MRGMIGLDNRPDLIRAKRSTPNGLLKPTGNITAKNTVAKAKTVASPYFGANDFAFAYALA